LNKALKDAAGTDTLVPDGKKPAVELITDKLHPLACRLFDALFYYGDRQIMLEADAAYMRYLAIRWVMLNKTFMYFLKLPTTDLQQLALQGPGWKKVVDQLREPYLTLLPVGKKIDHLISAQLSARHERLPLIMHGDCRENIKQVDWSRPSFVGLNPPTAGNSTFMQSNKVLDTLLHNEPQKIDDGDMPGDLWKSLILDTAAHIPAGHYVFSFVGDGAVSWEDGCADVFSKVGPTIKQWSFPWHGSDTRRAGLILLRKA
jgi:hypothetical protein